MKTQCYVFLDPSRELLRTIDDGGPLSLLATPAVLLARPVVSADKCMGLTFLPKVVDEVLETIRERAALSCSFDPAAHKSEDVRRTLNHIGLAVQLAKPTRSFGEHWFQLDDGLSIEQYAPSLAGIQSTAYPYLEYQQHHQITLEEDIELVKRCLPRLQQALAPVAGSGSWGHPCGPVHRALVLFAEGYLPEIFGELPQYLWAMALDCLFSSKTDKSKRGAHTIGQRLKILFGAEYEPYKSPHITVPGHQKRPVHKLCNIVGDIFRLRNACAHGLPIPEAWLTGTGKPLHDGYAYQLCECTEILLRQTLHLILTEQKLFDVFVDSRKLDRYFG
jgi:hypothetical protein